MARFAWIAREQRAAEEAAAALAALRAERDQLLRASDWTQLPDAPISPADRAAWAAYRQELRDLPAQAAADPRGAKLPRPPKP